MIRASEAFFLGACGLLAALPGRAAESNAGAPDDLRAGFYLLHDNCHKESQLSMITLFKTTPHDVADFVDRISKLARESVATLDRFAAGDSSLRETRDPLPPFERATRGSIADDKRHNLLFGTKGTGFARALLLTQIDASDYIGHMAKVWSERDPDADRAATMRKMAERWLAIRNEAVRLLAAE